MKKTRGFTLIVISGMFLLSGCATLDAAGMALGIAGKTTLATAARAGSMAFKGIKTVVNMARGKEVVRLEKKQSTFYVNTVLNRRLRTKLILDTGCSNTQISPDIARKLGIRTQDANRVSCRLADGRTVTGRAVNIKEVRLGRARVANVKAVVLDEEEGAGLLGMSFLDNFVFEIDSEKRELVLQKR